MDTAGKIREALEAAIESYRANQKAGSPAESLAFDNGRIDGLKQALEIVEATT